MKSNKKNISQQSLEALAIALMSCKDEDGLLLNISPATAFQDWLLNKYPEPIRNMWKQQHAFEVAPKE